MVKTVLVFHELFDVGSNKLARAIANLESSDGCMFSSVDCRTSLKVSSLTSKSFGSNMVIKRSELEAKSEINRLGS